MRALCRKLLLIFRSTNHSLTLITQLMVCVRGGWEAGDGNCRFLAIHAPQRSGWSRCPLDAVLGALCDKATMMLKCCLASGKECGHFQVVLCVVGSPTTNFEIGSTRSACRRSWSRHAPQTACGMDVREFVNLQRDCSLCRPSRLRRELRVVRE